MRKVKKKKNTKLTLLKNFYQFTYLSRSNSGNILRSTLDMQSKHWAG